MTDCPWKIQKNLKVKICDDKTVLRSCHALKISILVLSLLFFQDERDGWACSFWGERVNCGDLLGHEQVLVLASAYFESDGDFENYGDERQVCTQCLSRLISYTAFVAFLYILTVITNPPTTTNPCLIPSNLSISDPCPTTFYSSGWANLPCNSLYQPNFHCRTLAQPLSCFSGWANLPCNSWWWRRRGSISLIGAAWPNWPIYFLYDELFKRGEN